MTIIKDPTQAYRGFWNVLVSQERDDSIQTTIVLLESARPSFADADSWPEALLPSLESVLKSKRGRKSALVKGLEDYLYTVKQSKRPSSTMPELEAKADGSPQQLGHILNLVRDSGVLDHHVIGLMERLFVKLPVYSYETNVIIATLQTRLKELAESSGKSVLRARPRGEICSGSGYVSLLHSLGNYTDAHGQIPVHVVMALDSWLQGDGRILPEVIVDFERHALAKSAPFLKLGRNFEFPLVRRLTQTGLFLGAQNKLISGNIPGFLWNAEERFRLFDPEASLILGGLQGHAESVFIDVPIEIFEEREAILESRLSPKRELVVLALGMELQEAGRGHSAIDKYGVYLRGIQSTNAKIAKSIKVKRDLSPAMSALRPGAVLMKMKF